MDFRETFKIQTVEPLEGKDKFSRILLCSEYALSVVFGIRMASRDSYIQMLSH